MSDKQPDALRLADRLDDYLSVDFDLDFQKSAAELRRLHTENEALRADAGRYRWLRAQPNNTETPRIDVVSWQEIDESANGGEGLRMAELDAAIDAAMKGTQ